MEKEISSGAMLGIVLIALSVIIGLGFGVFSIAKGVANDGTVALQDDLKSISKSVFDDYNQKTVTGAQVMAAYDTFEGKPVAILIATQAHLKNQYGGQHADHAKPVRRFVHRPGIVNGQEYFMALNYNALLKNRTVWYTPKNGRYVTDAYQTDEGSTILYDKITTGFTRPGNTEYIPPKAHFESNLIKDHSGTIIGIAFIQVKN